MFAMMRSGLVALVALVLAGAGLALLLWLLRWLWKKDEKQKDEPVIEIKPVAPALETRAAAVDDEEEPPAGTEQEASAIEEEPFADVEEELPTAEEEPPAESEEEDRASEEPPKPAQPDDLKKIEGIGPKISGVLQAAGITTFAELADADPAQLGQILEDADPRLLRLADPTSWPDQASLAAVGNWEALDALKAELKGGRKQ